MHVGIFTLLLLIFAPAFCSGDTNLRDVAAINDLYGALGFPPLQGWVQLGGDPCLEKWQGVDCVFSNMTAIRLSGMNLGGELGSSLDFQSIIEIDLSNNHIGGNIPSILPATIRNFSLSNNQLTGNIPASLSSCTQMLSLSLNNNTLNGSIPDSFMLLGTLTKMDLSGNNLSGQLPQSVGNLSSLTTLNLQNNKLTGTLDVIQDLPLQDLNVENNLFSGPIPPKLLTVPNFRKEGNPFNTTIIPSPPAASPAPSVTLPPSKQTPHEQAHGPSASKEPTASSSRKSSAVNQIVLIASVAILIFVALSLFCLMRRCFRRRSSKRTAGNHIANVSKTPNIPFEAANQLDRAPKETAEPLHAHREQHRTSHWNLKAHNEKLNKKGALTSNEYRKDSLLDSSKLDSNFLHPLPTHAPMPLFTDGSSRLHQAVLTDKTSGMKPSESSISASVNLYTVELLQQYTDNFSEQNYVGKGILGSVYRAQLPNGQTSWMHVPTILSSFPFHMRVKEKLLAIKKLDNTPFLGKSQDEFLELVSKISSIRQTNIAKLEGYCAEDGQRLLVYEYCCNGSLHDALHVNYEIHKKLSWDARVRVALEAAQALKYLHEDFQPPIVHRNFKSSNILLNNKLAVQVSECGLESLLASSCVGQLSGRLLIENGYSAPEFETGSYSHQSDVYSFGVVMLELLTGRKSYDRSRPSGEQFLVRWAVPQLHDIDALSRMVDPLLKGVYSMKSLSRFADIISSCLQHEPEFRPAMSEVIQALLRMI